MDKQYFFALSDFLLERLEPEESLSLNLSAEESRFCRFNEGKVRQDGTVSDAVLYATLTTSSGDELRQLNLSSSLSQDFDSDCQRLAAMLIHVRNELTQLPPDPYARIPHFDHTSEQIGEGEPLPLEKVTDCILASHDSFRPTGIYSSGNIIRGQANSAGSRHWFSTPSWIMDYSLYGTQERAWKGFCSGKSWNQQNWSDEIEKARIQLDALERPRQSLQRGKYRVYLSPDAVADLMWFLGSIFSEAGLRRGSSPLCLVKSDRASFSPLLNFAEDFTSGDTPPLHFRGRIDPRVHSIGRRRAITRHPGRPEERPRIQYPLQWGQRLRKSPLPSTRHQSPGSFSGKRGPPTAGHRTLHLQPSLPQLERPPQGPHYGHDPLRLFLGGKWSPCRPHRKLALG